MTVIDLIKDAIPITDVLERYTNAKVKPGRKRLQLRCPFHNDHNPSFTVYCDTNTFRCWSGCNDGKPGDVIDIVRLACNVDTKQAIKILSADYGLTNPTGKQAAEWRKKRAERQRLATLYNGFTSEIDRNIDRLKKLEKLIQAKVTSIKTLKDMEQVGDLYHLLPQIDYWLDCLVDNDPVTQFEALKEIKDFFQDTKTKAGETVEQKH